MDLRQVAEAALTEMTKNVSGAEGFTQASLVVSKELSIESNKISLLRTTFDQNLMMKVFKDNKTATLSGNQFHQDAIHNLSKELATTVVSSQADEANGFAPNQGVKNFEAGLIEADDDYMYQLLSVFLEQTKARFPKIILEAAIIKFVKSNKVHMSTRGSLLTSQQGYYEGFTMFTAKDGAKSSSFNYTGYTIGKNNLNRTMMNVSGVEALLAQSSEQTEVKKVPNKFVGDIIVTPHCMEDFTRYWLDYISPASMIKKTSFLFDKKGQSVASPLFDLQALPLSDEFATKSFWNSDGYLTKNESLFKNGILNSYLLDHYASNKLNQENSLSGSHNLQFATGNTALQDMIANTKEGVLLARFSAGHPAENGDFSGSAKNSYYIKDGKIQYPIGETMLAGNLQSMLKDIAEVSKESIDFGSSKMPWVKFKNITVS